MNQIPNVMEVDDLVDAALVGFDRGSQSPSPLGDVPALGRARMRASRAARRLGGAPAQRYRDAA